MTSTIYNKLDFAGSIVRPQLSFTLLGKRSSSEPEPIALSKQQLQQTMLAQDDENTNSLEI